MITIFGRLARRWEAGKARYLRWERQASRRFAGWSPRRRLLVFVLLPILLLCCGGVVGVPVLWVARQTVAAGRGAPSPEAAANGYLMLLSYANEEGLLPLLDDERQNGLLAQWRAYRDAMRSTVPPPFRLDFDLTPDPTAAGRAEVRSEVQAVWWNTDDSGRMGGYKSNARTWIFEVRDDDGWRVAKVSAPPWCGADGYVPHCGAAPLPSVTSPSSPTASPSSDLLENPREMLPCGPRDPFTELHSCPPTTPSTSGGTD